MKKTILAMAIAVATAMGTAGAQAQSDQAQSHEQPGVPRSAFYVGAGAAYTFTNFGQQWIYNQGISTASVGGVPVASGSAAGPANPIFSNQSNFAPVAQLGYFRHFEGSNWLWGAKFSYSYLGTTSNMRSLIIPQPGSSSAGLGSFGGGSVIGSYNITINHQTTLMPMVGRSFEKSFFYLGAGPSLSQISTSLETVVGYATFGNNNVNVSGQPQSFYTSQWTWGASATAGATFFLTKSWFLDLNYVFSMPNASITYLTSPFNNPGNGGLAFTGLTLYATHVKTAPRRVLAD